VSDDDILNEIAMIEENLAREFLGPALEAARSKRLKELYLFLHPET
jgi:hypothetical protein